MLVLDHDRSIKHRRAEGRSVLACAHVPRPELRPDLLLYFATASTNLPPPATMVVGTRVVGGSRSEVKGEGRAKHGPEDMSGGNCPLPVSRKGVTSVRSGGLTC